MQIDWEETINGILADRLVCPRCSATSNRVVAGYSRKPTLNAFAPRHRHCPRGADCEARKLITLCEDCARAEHLRGTLSDAAELLEVYLLDCRRDLEESLDYLAEYWRDDTELSDDDYDRSFEDVAPEDFGEEQEWRQRLEQEYMLYHREFRERDRRIPAPGWRSEYAEELRGLGYDTLLGD